jgi:hypothetical protein
MSIDTLVDLQNQRLADFKNAFDEDVRVLDQEFNTERTSLILKHSKEKAEIMDIMARAEHEFQEVEADAKHEFSSIKDDVKNKVIYINDVEFRRKTCIEDST